MFNFKKISKNNIPHIIIDAYALVHDHFSGVGYYTLGLVRGLDELAANNKLTYSLLVNRHLVNRLQKYNLKYYKIIINPIPQRLINLISKLKIPFPFDLFTGRGLYLFTGWKRWSILFNKSFFVVYDLTFYATPQFTDKGNLNFILKNIKRYVKESFGIITISEFTKKEFVKYFNFESSRIGVVKPSIERKIFYKRSKREINIFKANYNIYHEYFLTVGNLEPRKNYSRLLKAYVNLPKEITDKYALIIVGAGSWKNKLLTQKIRNLKVRGFNIYHFVNTIQENDMPALYSGAKLFIYPSEYEGFGMPILEALACCIPVLTSNISSMPEASYGKAVYFDPYNINDISLKIKETITLLKENPNFYKSVSNEVIDNTSWKKSTEDLVSFMSKKPISYFNTL